MRTESGITMKLSNKKQVRKNAARFSTFLNALFVGGDV